MIDIAPNSAALVLAAGKGTRMRSEKPKVLQTLLGEPMLAYALKALEPLFARNIWIVAGHRAEMLEERFPDSRFIIQPEQLGTGHALVCAMPALLAAGMEWAVVVNGDAPLITTEALDGFLARARGADIAFATITLENAGAYGRVIRKDGQPTAIVEARDFDRASHGEDSGEVNAGIYLFRLEAIAPLLPRLENANKSGEYYLTDLIGLGVAANLKVAAVNCGEDTAFLGVNSPLELADTEDILAWRVAAGLMANGAIIHAPRLLRASPFATVEPGAEIFCPCEISGSSVIRSGASIGSHCVIHDSEIGPGARIRPYCHLDGAIVGPEAVAGPHTRLRPGAELAARAHAGNFVELKNAVLGPGAKANHLTYLGDARIGAGANIGAGTITCNYDGKHKHQTRIGRNAFIGSNTALVAPVAVGEGALVGAGSVITRDVQDNEMAIARGRQKNMPQRGK